MEKNSYVEQTIGNQTMDLTNEQRLQAAYALNLCAVSVSQIVEYQDINIMEQEYEAILNNLNLENMPKDQALLDILTQILNVITFFRIQDGDKKIIEKKYEQKMKNAIWKAIPNPSVLLFSGSSLNPVSIGMSLAYTVGTGYMNYRNAKAENNLEVEEERWKLQRSAIEQLNALRRELFTTAWRLAETYRYPDKYRLTENQIKHYNEILMDNDVLRKYERLDYIKDDFEAYPTFWYQLGHAANAVVWTRLHKLNLSEEQRYQSKVEYTDTQKDMLKEVQPYIAIAKDCFEKYFSKNANALLRSDETVATCALEYIDLFDPSEDRQRIIDCLNMARHAISEKLDTLQLLAFKYVQLNMWDEAIPLLRHCVTEDYNKTLNGQILSAVYVKKYLQNKDQKIYLDYKLLEDRIGDNVLFPIDASSLEEATNDFTTRQRNNIRERFARTLNAVYHRYNKIFNEKLPAPEKKGKMTKELGRQIYNSDLLNQYAIVIGDFYDSLSSLYFVEREELYNCFITQLKVDDIKQTIDRIQDLLSKEDVSLEEYEDIKKLSFDCLTKKMIDNVIASLERILSESKKMSEFMQIETALISWCERENVDMEGVVVEQYYETHTDVNAEKFNLLGTEYEDKKANSFSVIKAILRESLSDTIKDKSKMAIYYKGTTEFNTYIDESNGDRLHKHKESGDIIAILDDRTPYDYDLVFTTSKIIPIHKGKDKSGADYSDIKKVRKYIAIGSSKYDHNNVNLEKFEEMIEQIKPYAIKIDKITAGDVALMVAVAPIIPGYLVGEAIVNGVKAKKKAAKEDDGTKK